MAKVIEFCRCSHGAAEITLSQEDISSKACPSIPKISKGDVEHVAFSQGPFLLG